MGREICGFVLKNMVLGFGGGRGLAALEVLAVLDILAVLEVLGNGQYGASCSRGREMDAGRR